MDEYDDFEASHVKRRRIDLTDDPQADTVYTGWPLHRPRPDLPVVCPCLDVRRLGPPTTSHLIGCPMNLYRQHSHKRWIYEERLAEDPARLHTDRTVTNDPNVDSDVANDVDRAEAMAFEREMLQATSGQSSLQEGYNRIDKFVSIINFIRTHIKGCDIFYRVTDKLLRHYFAQFLPVIVGDDNFPDHADAFYRYARLQRVKPHSFATTPRQIGKTTTIAIVLAAVLCCVDGGEDFCKIYSKTEAQAIALLVEAKHIFDQLPDEMRPKRLDHNTHTFHIESSSNGKVISVAACSGNVNGCRGHHPRVIIVDEYQFTLAELWCCHIWSLMSVSKRILICASTPGEPGSYMAAETMKMKTHPDNAPRAEVLDFSLVCSTCRAAGTPLACKCVLPNIPPWKNVTEQRSDRSKYSGAQAKNLVQEMLGEPCAIGMNLFDPRQIDAMFNAPRGQLGPIAGNVIYVAVDPSGGGDSECAVISFCFLKTGQILILGIDSCTTKELDCFQIASFIEAHVKAVRRLQPEYTECAYLVPIVEDQNKSHTVIANSIVSVIMASEPSREMCGYKMDPYMKGRGVPTTNQIKSDMAYLFQDKLQQQTILLCDRTATSGMRSCEESSTSSATADDLYAMLKDQLKAFFLNKEDLKDFITGKLGPGYKDDIGMALLIGVYWSTKLRYKHWAVLVDGEMGSIMPTATFNHFE